MTKQEMLDKIYEIIPHQSNQISEDDVIKYIIKLIREKTGNKYDESNSIHATKFLWRHNKGEPIDNLEKKYIDLIYNLIK